MGLARDATEAIVPDDTKAIVDQADPLVSKLVEVFAGDAQARELFVDPARGHDAVARAARRGLGPLAAPS